MNPWNRRTSLLKQRQLHNSRQRYMKKMINAISTYPSSLEIRRDKINNILNKMKNDK